ncbi:hypothetical protein [uncultured Clostridium sp.]|uniref:hypothetical protein n=1 Tax=uncultured Clostridium sp. TaxID=59620 RepID=UPI0025D5D1A4|nr:hypothetical protein [uncultured Clostridium sp.]
MISEKMDLIYSTLQSEGFELSSASYEKDEYHIFYKDGLVLTIDLSTEDIKATMMYFDVNHEFVSYTYDLNTLTSFDDLLEHVLNIISTNSMILKWNLTLYELIHLDKLIFLSMRDLKKYTSNENLSSIKIDRIMNFDPKLFDMLLGSSTEDNQITLFYNKLTNAHFKIMLIEKNNTGVCNITRALFKRNGVLITLFYEESGVVLCGDIHFQAKTKIQDDLYINDNDILDYADENHVLYRLKFSEPTFEHVLELIDNTNLIYINMNNNAYKKINLSNSINYLTNKYHTRLDSISNELTSEDLTHLGM